VVLVTIKMTVDVVGIFYAPMAASRYYSSIAVHCFVPTYVSIMYGSLLFCLARGSAALAPMNRVIRDRLIALSTYLMIQLMSRAILVSFTVRQRKAPIPFQVFSNVIILLWGFSDRYVY